MFPDFPPVCINPCCDLPTFSLWLHSELEKVRCSPKGSTPLGETLGRAVRISKMNFDVLCWRMIVSCELQKQALLEPHYPVLCSIPWMAKWAGSSRTADCWTLGLWMDGGGQRVCIAQKSKNLHFIAVSGVMDGAHWYSGSQPLSRTLASFFNSVK